MNKTSNYQLCQWDGSDRILRTDFNEDNAKIDAALKSHANSIATINSALSGKASTSTVNSLTNTVNQKANQSALTAEVNARTQADQDLADADAAEAAARAQADSTEKAAREAADTAEAAARAQGDAAEAAARTAALALKGNCQIYYNTYVGDGAETKTLTFPGKPLMAFVMGDNQLLEGLYGNINVISRSAGTRGEVSDATWTENSLTWKMRDAVTGCNYSGETYRVLALMAMDE